MPELTLNGEPCTLEAGATLLAAVRASGATELERGIAVALDGEVVPRREWDRRVLEAGQRVEVVQAVQGG